LLCLFKLDFIGTGSGDDISAFLSFPGVWKHTRLESEPHTTQTEQPGSEEEKGMVGTKLLTLSTSTSNCHASTLLKRAWPHNTFPLSKKKHKRSGWSWLDGRENGIGAQQPIPGQGKGNLHGCLQYYAARSRAVTRL